MLFYYAPRKACLLHVLRKSMLFTSEANRANDEAAPLCAPYNLLNLLYKRVQDSMVKFIALLDHWLPVQSPELLSAFPDNRGFAVDRFMVPPHKRVACVCIANLCIERGTYFVRGIDDLPVLLGKFFVLHY